jgi:hypothetical protein
LGVSQRAIGNALKRLKISYKKTLSHPKADENARRIFQDRIEAYQTDKNVHFFLLDCMLSLPLGKRLRGVQTKLALHDE